MLDAELDAMEETTLNQLGRRALIAALVGFLLLRHVLSERAGLFGQLADNAV